MCRLSHNNWDFTFAQSHTLTTCIGVQPTCKPSSGGGGRPLYSSQWDLSLSLSSACFKMSVCFFFTFLQSLTHTSLCWGNCLMKYLRIGWARHLSKALFAPSFCEQECTQVARVSPDGYCRDGVCIGYSCVPWISS